MRVLTIRCKQVVSTEQGQELANELGIPFLETSAKANINVEDAFVTLARSVSYPLTSTLMLILGTGISKSA